MDQLQQVIPQALGNQAIVLPDRQELEPFVPKKILEQLFSSFQDFPDLSHPQNDQNPQSPQLLAASKDLVLALTQHVRNQAPEIRDTVDHLRSAEGSTFASERGRMTKRDGASIAAQVLPIWLFAYFIYFLARDWDDMSGNEKVMGVGTLIPSALFYLAVIFTFFGLCFGGCRNAVKAATADDEDQRLKAALTASSVYLLACIRLTGFMAKPEDPEARQKLLTSLEKAIDHDNGLEARLGKEAFKRLRDLRKLLASATSSNEAINNSVKGVLDDAVASADPSLANEIVSDDLSQADPEGNDLPTSLKRARNNLYRFLQQIPIEVV